MRLPLDACGHNDPINNPDGNKYGGISITPDGVVIQVTPNVTPPVYPPDSIAPDGSIIQPSCDKGELDFPGAGELQIGINAFCVDGNPLTTWSKDYHRSIGFVPVNNRLSLSAKQVDTGATYKQGPTVCRGHDIWKGKILMNDCKSAFYSMRDRSKCILVQLGGQSVLTVLECALGEKKASFIYNCVEWSWVVTRF